MKYQFVLSVWGKRHTDLFLSLALPALMTTGNLLGFSRYDSELDIYTTAESKAYLDDKKILQALSGFMRIRVTTMGGGDLPDDQAKYQRMNDGHKLAAARSAERDSVIVFLSPDAVFADGTLAYCRTQIEAGKRAVMLPTARGAAAPLTSALIRQYNPLGTFGLAVSPRQLATLLLQYPHDSEQFLRWANSPFTEWPSRIMFPVGDEGYVLRALHNHPMAVYPKERRHVPSSTMDARWLIDVVPDLRDWHLIQNSDDAFAVDVGTKPGLVNSLNVLSCDEPSIARWIVKHGDDGHKWMIAHNIRIHNGRQSDAWREVEASVTRLFDRITALTKLAAA